MLSTDAPSLFNEHCLLKNDLTVKNYNSISSFPLENRGGVSFVIMSENNDVDPEHIRDLCFGIWHCRDDPEAAVACVNNLM